MEVESHAHWALGAAVSRQYQNEKKGYFYAKVMCLQQPETNASVLYPYREYGLVSADWIRAQPTRSN